MLPIMFCRLSQGQPCGREYGDFSHCVMGKDSSPQILFSALCHLQLVYKMSRPTANHLNEIGGSVLSPVQSEDWRLDNRSRHNMRNPCFFHTLCSYVWNAIIERMLKQI